MSVAIATPSQAGDLQGRYLYLPTGPPRGSMFNVVLPVTGSRICCPRCGVSLGGGGLGLAPEGPFLGGIGLGCSLGRLLCIFKKSQLSSRAMASARGVRLRDFGHPIPGPYSNDWSNHEVSSGGCHFSPVSNSCMSFTCTGTGVSPCPRRSRASILCRPS